MATALKKDFTFRYRDNDSPFSVKRETAKKAAAILDVSETDLLHLALRAFVKNVVPAYEQDNGPITAAQMKAAEKLVPQDQFVMTETFIDV